MLRPQTWEGEAQLWKNQKREPEPVRCNWGGPEGEWPGLVSADPGTEPLLMDGVRAGQAPGERRPYPLWAHQLLPAPNATSLGLGINLCLGRRRAEKEKGKA